jgi:hypothetical protein
VLIVALFGQGGEKMDAFIGFFGGILLSGIVFYLARNFWINKIKAVRKRNVLEDLDFATTEQLLDEFRSRPNNSYIILMPVKNNDEQGIKIECNKFTPFDGVSMLHLATNLMYREMKKSGIPTPELPPMADEEG